MLTKLKDLDLIWELWKEGAVVNAEGGSWGAFHTFVGCRTGYEHARDWMFIESSRNAYVLLEE